MQPTMFRKKRCSQCKELKELATGFHKDKSMIDGRQSICKECRKKYGQGVIWKNKRRR